MSLERDRPVALLIARYGMDVDIPDSLPVPIADIAQREGWELDYQSGMGTLAGLAVIDGPARIITINADLDHTMQRFVIAHELAHAINGDIDSLHLLTQASWFTSKAERWASETAAEILIPDAAVGYADTIEELATLCDVPLEVAEMRMAGITK